jgi:hypothetical protein
LVLKLLPFAAGLGQVLLARWVAGRVFPERRGVQALAIAFAAAIPMNLYTAQFFTNEGLAGFLIGLTICQAIVVTARERYALREFAWLGLFAGLALLTKYSGLVAFVAVLCVLATHQVGHRRPTKAVALSLGASVGVALLVASGFYVRNFARIGVLFPGNWQFKWWQDSGFHTGAYWTRFGAWFDNPFKVGLNSFFALGAVVPLALIFAEGFQSVDKLAAARAPALRIALFGWLGTLIGGVFLAYLF